MMIILKFSSITVKYKVFVLIHAFKPSFLVFWQKYGLILLLLHMKIITISFKHNCSQPEDKKPKIKKNRVISYLPQQSAIHKGLNN